jgi:hypothetical protein
MIDIVKILKRKEKFYVSWIKKNEEKYKKLFDDERVKNKVR